MVINTKLERITNDKGSPNDKCKIQAGAFGWNLTMMKCDTNIFFLHLYPKFKFTNMVEGEPHLTIIIGILVYCK